MNGVHLTQKFPFFEIRIMNFNRLNNADKMELFGRVIYRPCLVLQMARQMFPATKLAMFLLWRFSD